MSRKQIGTVTIKRVRVYPLDPVIPDGTYRELASWVIVEPGIYPVYRDGLSHYWRMYGMINHDAYRMGDRMFAINPGDVPSDDDVVFYSQRYGPDEWTELLAAANSDSLPLEFTLEQLDV